MALVSCFNILQVIKQNRKKYNTVLSLSCIYSTQKMSIRTFCTSRFKQIDIYFSFLPWQVPLESFRRPGPTRIPKPKGHSAVKGANSGAQTALNHGKCVQQPQPPTKSWSRLFIMKKKTSPVFLFWCCNETLYLVYVYCENFWPLCLWCWM